MANQLDPQDLRETVRRAMANDPDAWESLYRHCRPRLLRYARSRLSTTQQAEDAVSDTVLRAMERIDTFTWQGAGFDAWLFGILRNVVLESYRGQERTRRLARRADEIDLTRRHSSDVSEGLERAEDAAALRAAFTTLGEDDRELLELRVVGGLTSDAAATVLGKSPGAVRMAQTRALDRLRAALRTINNA